MTCVVYIQDQVNWVLVLRIPSILIALLLLIFLVGRKKYFQVKLEGSVLYGTLKVFVGFFYYKKLNLEVVDLDGNVYR